MKVNAIYPTIQGEGALVGTPMVLVRLQGCSVRCPWCDTKESWMHARGDELSVGDVVQQVKDVAGACKWVMLTGGEPLEQDTAPLIVELRRRGFMVQIETSGTVYDYVALGYADNVCVSPKLGMVVDIDAGAIAAADDIKWIVGNDADVDALHAFIEEYRPDAAVWVQPKHGVPGAVKLCLQTVQQTGWRLSVQVHKYIKCK